MNFEENKVFLNLLSVLFVFIPFTLILGPFFPDLIIVITILSFFSYAIIKNDYSMFNNKILIFFILICTYFSLISLFANNFMSIKSSIFYFRFGVFSILASYLIFFNKNILKNLFHLLLIIYLFLFIDTLYQYNFSKNILGFVYNYGENFRVTSFFKDDEVLGSYTARFFPLLLFLVINNFKNKFSKNFSILVLFLTLISFTIIVLSGERTSIGLFILSFLFILFSSENFRKKLFIPLLIIIIGFVILTSSSDKVKNRVITQTMSQMGLNAESDRLILFSKTYEGHYLISYNMFKEKPLFGHGPKMFRVYCQKEENFVAGSACTTHPHNFYAQMLAETGMIGFISILSIFFYIVYLFLKNIYFLIFKKKQLITDEAICLLSFYFMTFFPFLPSGSFFNNWMSVIVYYPLGFLIYIINIKKFYV